MYKSGIYAFTGVLPYTSLIYRTHIRKCSDFKLAQKNFQVRGTNARAIHQTKPARPFGPTSGRSLCTCTQTKQSKTSSTKDVILVLVRPICLQVHNKRFYGHQELFTGQYQFWGYTEEGPRLLWTLILSLSNRVLGLALGCLSISFVMLEILGVLKRIRGPQVPIGAHSWA